MGWSHWLKLFPKAPHVKTRSKVRGATKRQIRTNHGAMGRSGLSATAYVAKKSKITDHPINIYFLEQESTIVFGIFIQSTCCTTGPLIFNTAGEHDTFGKSSAQQQVPYFRRFSAGTRVCFLALKLRSFTSSTLRFF